MTRIPHVLRILAAVLAVLLYVVTPGAANQAAQSAAATCFTPDIKIVCGKTPGTFVITLTANISNGASPVEAEIVPVTPGITILNAKPVYQVAANGEVKLVISGALPGDVIEFAVSGSRPNPQAGDGLSVCCRGKVTLSIPKDVKCGDKDIVDLAIEKSGATTPNPAGNGYAFTLAVTNKGSAFTGANPITVKDSVPAGMTFTSASGTDWSCTTLPAAAGATVTCTYTGVGPAAGQALPPITIAAKANGKPPYPGFKNCAKVGPFQDAAIVDSNPANNKSCVVIDKPKKFDVSIEKSCAPASLHKVALGPAVTGLAYTANCKIKVTSTGNVSSPISVSEALTAAGGSITSLSTNPSTDPWACSPALPSAGPLNCTLPANTLTGPTDSSEIDVTVQFPPTGDHTTAQNCARLSVGGKPAGKSCVDIPHEIQSSRTVTKVCDPATEVVGAINHYESKCHITVSTTGPQSGTVEVHDNMNGAGTITTMSTSTTPAWSCTVPDCSINGSALNQTASTSVIDVNVSFATQGHVTEGQNCAIAGVDGKPVTEKTCVPFATVVNPPQQSKIDISKTCSAYTQLTATGPWVAQCAVTVTATGSPLPPVIGFAENMTYSGSASPIGISAMNSAEPWSCTTVPANANTPVSCTLASSSLPASGSSTVNLTVSLPQGVTAGEAKNCAQAQGLDAGGKPLAPPVQSQQACVDLPGTKSVTTDGQARITISKQVMYNGTVIAMPGVAFPVTASCDAGVISVATDQPASTGNIAPGTGCTITEGVMPAAAVSLGEQRCAAPMKPKWMASYAPAQTVTASPGVTVAITNTLTCQPPSPSVTISKVCDPATQIANSQGYQATCHITVDTVGAIGGYNFNVQDTIVGSGNATTGQMSTTSSNPFCFPNVPSCIFHGSTLSQTSSSTVIDVPVTFPDAGSVAASQNCVQLNATPYAVNTQACASFTFVDPALNIKKVVVNNAPGSVEGLTFPITATCVKNAGVEALDNSASHNLASGQTQFYLPYMAGGNCTIHEGAMPTTTACGNKTPVWTTTYSPSQTVAMVPQGEIVTVTNTLSCKTKINDSNATIGTQLDAGALGLSTGTLKVTKGCNYGVDAGHQFYMYGVKHEIYNVHCALTITGTGPFPDTIHISDFVAGSAVEGLNKFISAASTDNWQCAVPSYWATPLTCAISGSDFAAAGGISVINVEMRTTDKTVSSGTNNCALVSDNPNMNLMDPQRVCVPLQIISPHKSVTITCDKDTARLVGDTCRCTVRGMVPVSKMACGCSDGTQLKNGECRKVVVPQTPPKDPVCGKSQRLQNHKCVDVPPPPPPPCGANERRNAAGKCVAVIPDCPRGSKWNGKRCVDVIPDCAHGTHWNGKRCVSDVPDCPQGTVFNGKRCVPQVVQCEPGQIRIGKRCIDQPRCARGQIALPGTGICVDLKSRGDKPRDPKPGPVDVPSDTGGCVPLPGKPCR